MQAHLVGIIVGSTIAGTILCVALFFVLKCLRRRRREAIDEETSTISSQSTQDTQSSLTSAEQQAADYSAIYRRVVPCFAEGEYTGPSAREGKFVYGGSLLDNVQQPSAEDLARAGYEPVAAPGEGERPVYRLTLSTEIAQPGDRQTQSSSEGSSETSDPAPAFNSHSSVPAQPSRSHSRPILERARPLSCTAYHPGTQRFRPESDDRTIRHRSWTPVEAAQSGQDRIS